MIHEVYDVVYMVLNMTYRYVYGVMHCVYVYINLTIRVILCVCIYYIIFSSMLYTHT